MGSATKQQILNVLLETQQQMHQGFYNVDLKLVSLEQRLTGRIDGLEERLGNLEHKVEHMNRNLIEDISALNSVLMNHEQRLTKLEKSPV